MLEYSRQQKESLAVLVNDPSRFAEKDNDKLEVLSLIMLQGCEAHYMDDSEYGD